MPEPITMENKPERLVHHTGRLSQVGIYLGKQLRFFVNQSDWKVLPMAAVIAALVAMVIKDFFFITMEGSLMGGFALTCVGIWNGCFNSIQSICRERAIIKREHRSGLHISSYILAHMIYQFLLCAAQSALTLYVMNVTGVAFPFEGFMTPWMLLDLWITLLLITYAADMLSLFLSSISHTTTGAMTLMPFILIFQLIFSGSVIPLPDWGMELSRFTISNYGIRAVAAQSGYNERPMNAVWKTLQDMDDTEIGGEVTVGQLLDILDSSAVEKRRDMEVLRALTVDDAADFLISAEQYLGSKKQDQEKNNTIAQVIEALRQEEGAEEAGLQQLTEPVTLGRIVDILRNSRILEKDRDRSISLSMTMGEVYEILGKDNVKEFVQQKTREAGYKEIYEKTEDNIIGNWVIIGLFIIIFAVLATVSLELIDKDKR